MKKDVELINDIVEMKEYGQLTKDEAVCALMDIIIDDRKNSKPIHRLVARIVKGMLGNHNILIMDEEEQ